MVINGFTNHIEQIANLLRQGKVGLIPTDTLYGISCLAQNEKSVQRVYKIKGRELNKPFIILIDSVIRLGGFDINLSEPIIKMLKKLWPNKVSVILKCVENKFQYLHSGTNKLSFRVPKHKELLELLEVSGPLVSTSANISGKPPITNIKEAQETFADQIDFYVEEGTLKSKATTVIELSEEGFKVIRQGDYIVDPLMLK